MVSSNFPSICSQRRAPVLAPDAANNVEIASPHRLIQGSPRSHGRQPDASSRRRTDAWSEAPWYGFARRSHRCGRSPRSCDQRSGPIRRRREPRLPSQSANVLHSSWSVCFRKLPLRDIEVHPEDPTRSHVRIPTEPALGAIGHAEAKLVMIGFTMLGHACLLGITGLQILQGNAFAHLLGRNISGVFGQSEETSLLLVNASLAAGDVGFEGAHASRVQCKPQTQLALAKRSLGFLQMRNIEHRADRAHRPSTRSAFRDRCAVREWRPT